jgi:hypothetical protein
MKDLRVVNEAESFFQVVVAFELDEVLVEYDGGDLDDTGSSSLKISKGVNSQAHKFVKSISICGLRKACISIT